jgi:hypothetical protein
MRNAALLAPAVNNGDILGLEIGEGGFEGIIFV